MNPKNLTVGSYTWGSFLILLIPRQPREGSHVSQATQQGGLDRGPKLHQVLPWTLGTAANSHLEVS